MARGGVDASVGYYAALRRMKARGLSGSAITDAMAVFDDAQQNRACRRVAQTLVKKYRALPAREARTKLAQALARRGFLREAISGAVERVLSDEMDFFRKR